MITITVKTLTHLKPLRYDLFGTIIVSGDDIISGDDDLLDTVRGRAKCTEGHTFEDRLRAAYPYSNGYVVWEVAEKSTQNPDAGVIAP